MIIKHGLFKSIQIFIHSFLLFVFTMCCFSLQALGDTSNLKCDGVFRGKVIDKKQLQSILSHRGQEEINLCDTTLNGIDLKNVDLRNINFSGADLSHANLQSANLSNDNLIKTFLLNANLSNANLQHAKMTGAILKSAKINGADFRRADLSYANLSHASLKNANLTLAILNNVNMSYVDLSQSDCRWADFSFSDLSHANLSNAYFENANLSFVNLKNSLLQNTNFDEANFDHVIYEPTLGALPNLNTFYSIKNFDRIQLQNFNSGKASLTELRSAYKQLGIRSMERTITAIIKHHEMISDWKRGGWGYLESTFNYLFFYLTCHFGANPGRPLIIFVISIFLFAIPYRYALSKPSKFSGIVAIWKPKRFVKWEKTHITTEPEMHYSKILKINLSQSTLLRYQWHLFSIAIFFSLLSAFSIGWKQINVSNWLSHLQSREYTLKGKGWIRILSGAQSITSAFLIVLWVLTYFASPFEW